MRRSGTHSVRVWLAVAGAGLAAASGMAVLNGIGAVADTSDITVHSGPALASTNEGTLTPNHVVATFTDAGEDCNNDSDNINVTIDWGDGSSTSAGTLGCDAGGDFTVSGRHRYIDSGTPAATPFAIKVKLVDVEDTTVDFTQTDSIQVDDLPIVAFGPALVEPAGPITEGQSATVTAMFIDRSPQGDAAGMVGGAKWPDGTTSQGTVTDITEGTTLPTGECCHVYKVTVTGTPDAGVHESEPFIGLHDDGGQTAATMFSLHVNDAALTKGANKSFTSTATQAATNVVASFTDAAGAQAAAADFTATIHWGDNTTSSGTVTKTAAGAFNVSGTHAYTTSGPKSLSITVTDEEGQTATMSATATVPALPSTGQPHGTSGWPLMTAVLIMLGLIGISAGLVRARLARR